MTHASETPEPNATATGGGPVEASASYASFGNFQLVAQLGKGGMGDVYLALARGIEGFKKLVVIKRLHADLAHDARSRELFLEEGRLTARLNHPNVVQTNEVGELDGALYMSMEYLEGQTWLHLARHWKPNENPRMVVRIIADALAGLHYAHELCDYDGTPLQIVHRDLTPHNIFITYEGVVKLLDFGIAKASVQSSKTEVGVFKGKFAYLAPEQLQEGEIDRRVDIFVIGIVLWESLAARRLFKATEVAKTFQQILTAPIPRLSTVVPDIDPALEAIVARALERDPADRYQTARELRDALEEYLAASGPPVRQEDIGALVRKLFQAQRDRARERVRMFMSVVEETSSPLHLPSLALPRRDSETSSRSGILPIAAKPANDGAHAEPAPPPRRSWRPALAGAGAIAIAALAATLFVGARMRPPALQEGQERAAPATPIAMVAPSPAPPPAEAVTTGEPSPAQPASPGAPAPAAPAVAVSQESAVIPTVPGAAPALPHEAHIVAASRHTAPEQTLAETSPAPQSPARTATAAPQPAPAPAPMKRKFRTEL